MSHAEPLRPRQCPGFVGTFGTRSCARAASDTACPKSRPRSPSRARLAVSRPKVEDSCPRCDAVAGSVMGSLISPVASADALAGTTSIVTSRSRCCARGPPESARAKTVPIVYCVNRFMTYLLALTAFCSHFREPGGLHARLARVIDFKLQPERLAGPAVRQARHQFVL